MDEFNYWNQSERNSTHLQETEDAQNYYTATQGIPRFNNAFEFNDFMEKFKMQCSNNEWKRINPLYEFNEITQEDILNATIYKYIRNNPMRNQPETVLRGLRAFNNNDFVTAVLHFDEIIRKGLGSLDFWSIFSKALIMINQFDRAIWVTKQILQEKPNDINRHILLCKIYTKYNCKYQICQSAFNWLKNHYLYGHLIPFDFTMNDKNSSQLDNNLFKIVEDFFIRALQLNVRGPDHDLQYVLQRLYYGNGDFDKVISCVCFEIISSNTISTAEIRTLGYCTFLNGYPNEALDVFFTITPSARRIECIDLGFVYMYLGEYGLAIVFFKQVIGPESLLEEFQIQGNTLKDEFELCLRLYWKCVY